MKIIKYILYTKSSIYFDDFFIL